MINPNPAEWTYVASYYIGTSEDIADDMADETGEAWEALEAAGRHPDAHTEGVKDSGRCDHCGAGHAWGAVFIHGPTGKAIAVGHTCGAQVFGMPDRAALIRARAERQVQTMRRARALRITGLRVGAKLLRAHPEVKAWLRSTSDFAKSIRASIFERGWLTERQEAAAITAAQRYAARILEQAAQKLLEPTATGTAPEGRVEVRGVVLYTWTKHSQTYGDTTMMKVATDAGWHLICSATKNAGKGDRVHLRITVKAGREPAIGWGKRPSLVKPKAVADVCAVSS
jgi:hypothetical protein